MTIFFDFNGTIIDDLKLTFDILNEMLIEEGHKEVTLETYLEIFDFPIKDYYIKAGFTFEHNSFETLAVKFINKYQPRSLEVGLHKNVIQTVLALKERGHKVVILSASKHDNLVQQLKHFKIYEIFDDVLGINDIYAKSKVDLAKNYIKNNRIESKDIIVIGDTLHDQEVAKALDGKMIFFSGGHQAKHRLTGASIIESYDELEKEIFNNV